MAFNHYAKIKRILESEPSGWIIKRIDDPTFAKNFKGETVEFTHYYRVYNAADQPIKYCKFQQLERLATALHVPVEVLPVIEDDLPRKKPSIR
jgi:hypothetical protein